jgi:formate-dependent nitrite reductase cytochrome c552 subunit
MTRRQAALAMPHAPAAHADSVDQLGTLLGYRRIEPSFARKLVTHPVSCIDCHASDSVQLWVTRPGFIEGIRALKAAQGVQNYDVNTMATRREMRAFVRSQCHVEYYFKGAEKRLVYPRANGIP